MKQLTMLHGKKAAKNSEQMQKKLFQKIQIYLIYLNKIKKKR